MTQQSEPQPLWPEGVLPEDITRPTLTWYPAPTDIATGASVIVCPGGGYTSLAPHEDKPIAEWLNTLGIHAIVLHYRLAPQNQHPAMLNDAARAVQTVRANAEANHSDPARIGILGFSAGGHLASTLSTHYFPGDPASPDPIARVSSRPDLAVLIYPVISLQEPHINPGSYLRLRKNLFGEEAPDPELVSSFCNETQVTSETPAAFLVHSMEDIVVFSSSSIIYALALQEAHVPFELHIYEKGPHGFGLGGDDPILSTWPTRCGAWLREHGF